MMKSTLIQTSDFEETDELIWRATAARAAQREQGLAFGEIVRKYQDLAFACAYGYLGDVHWAEDATQEAFIVAWRNIDQLHEPRAFTGWLKRIVVSQCTRLTRGRRVETVALDAANNLAAREPDPSLISEAHEERDHVRAVIAALPEHERMVTVLCYIADYAQKDIANFLEVPLTTVKKRLFSARQKLREGMLDMVRDTLQEIRPSRDVRFAETVALFNQALDSFVAKVQRDRYIVAGILFGSLAHDTVWRKSDIDVLLVARDDKTTNSYSLVENGINIHVVLLPRTKFRQMIEGSLQGTFMHSAFALSTLLFTTDDAIRAYYANVRTLGSRDRQLRLMSAGGAALTTLAKAEKWLVTRKDVSYSFLWIMFTIEHLAAIEVLRHDEITTREVIPRALQLNSTLFKQIYTDFIQQPKDEAAVKRVLDLIESYLDRHLEELFQPILDYLVEEGGVRTTTELDGYFQKQVQVESLVFVYEWLADKGILHKVPSPLRLTPKSQVTLDEAAYYYATEHGGWDGR